jgi:hypothetical protein
VVEGAWTSGGHTPLLPSHTSGTPHAESVTLRHTVPREITVSAGHTSLVPVQNSALSHGPAAARHATLGSANLQLTQQAEFESHCSPYSTIPFPHTELPQ